MENIGPGGRREGDPETQSITETRLVGVTPGTVVQPEYQSSSRVLAGGSLLEALAGAGTIVLAIIGLAGLLPTYVAAVCTIVAGFGLLAQGGAAASRWSRLLHEMPGSRFEGRAELGGGLGAELFGGGAGIVLGILALIGLLPSVLISIALLVFGATLLFASGATADLSQMGGLGSSQHFGMLAREAGMAASGTQVLFGLAAIVIGIMSFVSTGIAQTLQLVGLLTVGAAVLFGGSAITGRMMGTMRNRY